MARSSKRVALPPLPAGYHRSRLGALGDAIVARVTRDDSGESIDALHRFFAASFGVSDVDAVLDVLGVGGRVVFVAVGPQVRCVGPVSSP